MGDINIDELAKCVSRVIQEDRMNLKLAVSIISKAEKKASEINVPMVITVVDDGGNMTAQHRMDDALLAGISISYSKAYTAVALRASTAEAASDILPGQSLYGLQQTHPGRFCIFAGGIPIWRNGRCIGAVGVSGGSTEEDQLVAEFASSLN